MPACGGKHGENVSTRRIRENGVFRLSQLEFQHVSYGDGEKMIVKDLSVAFDTGDYVSIVGPSGSGKSTFLKLCCHLITPTAGRILFGGRDFLQQNPIELRKKISYCFQTPVLFGDTVEENLAFPYSIRNLKPDRNRVRSLFSRFNLEESYLTHPTQSLSGGEKQRIALIRTVLFRPEILLLDEVTSALDTENTRIVEDAVLSLNREGITILWVTHNPAQSRKNANKLLTIEDGRAASLEVLR